MSRQSADRQSVRNVAAWLSNNPNTIFEPEARFVDANDRIAVVSKRKSPLRMLIERVNGFYSLGIFGATVNFEHLG